MVDVIVKTQPESVLLADIGGTHARFALALAPDFALTEVQELRCADYAAPQDAALAYLSGLGARPGRAAFALACAVPASGGPVRMTNSAWVVAREQIGASLGLSELTLLNDFEAVALSLPLLAARDLRKIGEGAVDSLLPMAAIGPGTGLGVALCIPLPSPPPARWVALATEGGHATAAAADDFEAQVLSIVRGEFAHVSAERLLSGIGLPVLYRAVARVRGEPALDLTAEQVTARARGASDPACCATLDTFFAMLGTFAGNVALTAGARGGVFVAGGIARSLPDQLVRSRFRERFEAKGRFSGYLGRIATCLVTAPHCALLGAAHSLAQTGRQASQLRPEPGRKG